MKERRTSRRGTSATRSVVALLCASVLVVAACSSGGGDESSTGSTTGGDPPASSSIVWAIAGEVGSLDTSARALPGYSTADVNGVRQAELLQYDLDEDSCQRALTTEDIEGSWGIEEWSLVDGGKQLQFKIRPGTLSQAGNELTSEDVRWSIERFMAVDRVATSVFTNIGGFSADNPITIVDKYNFFLNVDNPSAATPAILTIYWFEIYDSVAVKANATAEDPYGQQYLTNHVANFGPWNLESFTPNRSVTYVPNPNYTGPRGNIDKVTLTTISDGTQRTQLLSRGEVNIAKVLSPQQLASLESNPNVTVKKCVSSIRDYLGLNASDPILSKVEVRRAMSMAIDRGALAEGIYLEEYGTPATHGVSAVFEPEQGDSFYRYDPEEAKRLLAQAGYPDGFPLTISITPSNPGDYVSSLAVLLQSQLGAIGIDVTINTVASNPTFTAAGAERQFQAYIWNETPAVANPGLGATVTFGCTASQNYGGFCNEEIDAQAKRTLAHTNNTPEYRADINKLSEMINQEQPAIYLVDVVKPEPISTCAASIPQSFQVDWSPLSEPVIYC